MVPGVELAAGLLLVELEAGEIDVGIDGGGPGSIVAAKERGEEQLVHVQRIHGAKREIERLERGARGVGAAVVPDPRDPVRLAGIVENDLFFEVVPLAAAEGPGTLTELGSEG